MADSKYFGKRPNINTFIHEGKNAKTQQNSYLTLGQLETLHFFRKSDKPQFLLQCILIKTKNDINI